MELSAEKRRGLVALIMTLLLCGTYAWIHRFTIVAIGQAPEAGLNKTSDFGPPVVFVKLDRWTGRAWWAGIHRGFADSTSCRYWDEVMHDPTPAVTNTFEAQGGSTNAFQDLIPPNKKPGQ